MSCKNSIVSVYLASSNLLRAMTGCRDDIKSNHLFIVSKNHAVVNVSISQPFDCTITRSAADTELLKMFMAWETFILSKRAGSRCFAVRDGAGFRSLSF